MRLLSFLAVIFLGGCAAQQPPVVEVPPLTRSIVMEDKAVMVDPVVEVAPKPRFVVENIMNLAPGTLRNILGNPSLERKEKGVQVWLYTNAECVLNLYFYPDDNGDFRLDYVATEATDPTAENPTVSPNGCLDSHVVPEGPIADPEPSSLDKNIDPQPDRLDN